MTLSVWNGRLRIMGATFSGWVGSHHSLLDTSARMSLAVQFGRPAYQWGNPQSSGFRDTLSATQKRYSGQQSAPKTFSSFSAAASSSEYFGMSFGCCCYADLDHRSSRQVLSPLRRAFAAAIWARRFFFPASLRDAYHFLLVLRFDART